MAGDLIVRWNREFQKAIATETEEIVGSPWDDFGCGAMDAIRKILFIAPLKGVHAH